MCRIEYVVVSGDPSDLLMWWEPVLARYHCHTGDHLQYLAQEKS